MMKKVLHKIKSSSDIYIRAFKDVFILSKTLVLIILLSLYFLLGVDFFNLFISVVNIPEINLLNLITVILLMFLFFILSALMIFLIKNVIYDEVINKLEIYRRQKQYEYIKDLKHYVANYFSNYVFANDKFNIEIYISKELAQVCNGRSLFKYVIDPDRHGKDIGMYPKREIEMKVDKFFEND